MSSGTPLREEAEDHGTAPHKHWWSWIPERFMEQLVAHRWLQVAIACLPRLPKWLAPGQPSHRGAWPAYQREVPERLRTVPGIWRDHEAAQEAYEKDPLRSLFSRFPQAGVFIFRKFWHSFLPTAPRLMRASRGRLALNEQAKSLQEPASAVEDPVALTEMVRRRAAELGMSAIGVAQYDPKYEFLEQDPDVPRDRVIICVLEQNYEATQTAPSNHSEKAALTGYEELISLATDLGNTLVESGYRVQVGGPEGNLILIHYGVEAGLGQLGVNGQLLTPFAGSRCRLISVHTNAPLVLDAPRDYGIHAICDECQVCVARCPVGAIPKVRKWHRGVLKAKLNTKRCLPIVAQVDGCAICMKVCPIQKYGLEAVTDHFEKTGEVLGKGTDDLEGYAWPLDGKHYGPGETPKVALPVVNIAEFPDVWNEVPVEQTQQQPGSSFL